jgi:ATP-dependent Zn protease
MEKTMKRVVFWLVIVISATLLWQVVRKGPTEQTTPEISYSEFLSEVEAGNVSKVTISRNEVLGNCATKGLFV